MRTKEISGYIHRDAVDKEYIEFFQEHMNVSQREYVKAKLIIELPERKVEITEGQLANAIFDSGYSGDKDNWEQLVKEIFGEEK